MPTDKYDAPIWKLEVEYERFLRYNYTRRAYLFATNALFDLLTAYPDKTMPGDFLTPDIEDWGRERAKRYAFATVRREICHIHAFFCWMWMAKGIEVPNPAIIVYINDKKVAGSILA